MAEISATEAARNFADLLDAIEHRGEHFTITRRGKVVAQLDPVRAGRGVDAKRLLAKHSPDQDWAGELASTRALVVPQDRS
jgi:prevent-host-death family protein